MKRTVHLYNASWIILEGSETYGLDG